MSILYILIYKRIKLIQEYNNSLRQAYIDLEDKNHALFDTKTELEFLKRINENIIDISPVVLFTIDSDDALMRMNSYGLSLFGYTEEELHNRDWVEILVDKDEREKVRELFSEKPLNNYNKEEYFENRFINKCGKNIDLLWNLGALDLINGYTDKFVAVGVDITQKNIYEENIKTMAFVDKLTGLPNKTMLEGEFERIITTNSMPSFSIVYLDIDNFKYINDTLGHHVGDEFLRHIGNLLKSQIKNPHFVARVSGDEFAILTELTSEEFILRNIINLKEKLGNTWNYHNYQFYISMSIGIVRYPEDGKDINILLKNAEIAMYAAKEQGKNKAIFYKDDLEQSNRRHIDMAHKIQIAKEKHEFLLYFQPQYELKTNRIFGAETLVRWNHQYNGFISPADFIPVAEKTGQIYRLEQWIFETALQQKKEWEIAGLDYIDLSINLSTKTLLSDEYFQDLDDLLSSYDLDYSKLTIEITETSIISNLDLVIDRLNKLKNKGIKIALDDFGTGYSSLTYLKKLPLDIIKLEKSFIDLVLSDEKDSLIVKSILRLANDLDFMIIAEGIETQEQLDYLIKYNCQNGQGYLLSKPLPASEVTNLFINNKISL